MIPTEVYLIEHLDSDKWSCCLKKEHKDQIINNRPVNVYKIDIDWRLLKSEYR